MTEALEVPLTPAQQRRFRQLANDMAALQRVQTEVAAAIIGSVRDPEELATWKVELTDTAIRCTPPTSPGPLKVE